VWRFAVLERSAGRAVVDCSKAPRQRDRLLGEVDADHPAAGSLEKLSGELSDQAEADHGDTLAEPDVGLANRVQGDAPDRREGALGEADSVGQPDAEVARDVDELGVDGGSAGARHAVTCGEAAHARSDLVHDTRRGIAER
jgi:hypothetical protein